MTTTSESLRIQAARPPLALDHRALFEVGLAYIRRIAGKVWTDHNIHDPGITALELLCYAVTDLSYRAGYGVADLLTPAAGPPASGFLTARQLLPSRPVTEADYRRLLIDLALVDDGTVTNPVRNAWLFKAERTLYADTVVGELSRTNSGEDGVVPVPLGGLYDVLLLLEEGADATRTIEAVRAELHAHRNLCEDFEQVAVVPAQDFNLCAELELDPLADVAEVHARVLFEVGQYLSPRARRQSLEALLDQGVPVDEIFNGPALDWGFITDAELARADLRTELYLSDVIRVIMGVEGVHAVTDIVLTETDSGARPAELWVLPVKPRHAARLNRAGSRLVSFKRGMPVPARGAVVQARQDALEAAARALPGGALDLEAPKGSYRGPDLYHSFQNDFPVAYGLSELGLPSPLADLRPGVAEHRTRVREGQARQLKAYLLLFDQLLADYLAALARVAELFSTDPWPIQTFFHQQVRSFRDARLAYTDRARVPLGATEAERDAILAAADAEIAATLAGLDDPASDRARRHAFLDHLLARFAEGFASYVAVVHEGSPRSNEDLVRMKCAFLADYPTISRDRGGATDLFGPRRVPARPMWDTDNVSGLQVRLAHLLGIPNANRRKLSDIDYDLYAEIDTTPSDEFRFRVRHHETTKIILSGSARYLTPEAARAEMRVAIDLAQTRDAYQLRQTSDGRFYFNIVDETGEVVARRIEYFADAEQREVAIEQLVTYLRERYSDEGMFLVEQILLRPQTATDPLLFICADPQTCGAVDPYSYRVQILLPAYSRRFRDPAFRGYVEQTIREECPAHILPKICWLGPDDMARVELAWKAWLELLGGVDTSARQARLQALRDALAEVKNTYPSATLGNCESGSQHFVLNRTALGTLEEDTP